MTRRELDSLIWALGVLADCPPAAAKGRDKDSARRELLAHFSAEMRKRELASRIEALTSRLARVERASAALGRVRALQARASRLPPSRFGAELERASRNTMRALGREGPISRVAAPGATDWIEAAGRVALDAIKREQGR